MLQKPFLLAACTCECTFDMPKELVFQKTLWNGPAIDSDEGAWARALLMWMALAMSSFPVPLSRKGKPWSQWMRFVPPVAESAASSHWWQ